MFIKNQRFVAPPLELVVMQDLRAVVQMQIILCRDVHKELLGITNG